MSSHSHDSGSHAHGNSHHGGGGGKGLVTAIVLVLVGYLILLLMGLPQKWTDMSNSNHHDDHHAEAGDHHAPGTGHGEEGAGDHHDSDPATDGHAGHDHPDDHADHDHEADKETAAHGDKAKDEHAAHEVQHPPYWMIAPFACLLLCIAVLPLIPATEHWWESNLHRFLVAAVLGAITLAYYAFMSDFTIVGHWPCHFEVGADGSPLAKIGAILANSIIDEYIPFIVLLFALFTITGGIRIQGDLKASPKTNTVIILIGTLLASFVGTTGAAMLLIRLLLETNKQRKYKVHTVVFFIFCVCNCGGCLLPIGDPPLFLGYLRDVAFTWTLKLWPEWLFVNGLLLALYFTVDTFWFYRKESAADLANDHENTEPLKITGLALNLPLLIGVVLAVAFLAPSKALFEINGEPRYPPYFLREIVQIALCGASMAFGSKIIRQQNEFNFHAILEVAALFFGIFICMQAPLQILNVEGKNLGINTAMKFYWTTGALSSVLDNAPTYVVFFETAKSLSPNDEKDFATHDNYKDKIAAEPDYVKNHMVPVKDGFIDHHFLAAISLGAVFMGAMTYIGNGPNFMVKAIAEQSGVKMPSFFGYMAYSICFLIPIFLIMTLIFLH